MQKISRSLIALGGLAALAACGDDVSITPPAVIPAAVVGVTVSPASLTLKVGESATLGVSVETTGGAGSGVTWTSSTPAVATVSATGGVTAVAAGNTTVRATSTVDNTKSGAAQVTVTAPVVRSVTVTPSALALTVGGTGNAVATVDRDAPLAGTVTWASSATSVATVSTAGVISAVAAGNAVITATSTADPTKLAALAVTVSAIPNNLLSLNVAPASVNVGPGATQQLTSTVNTVGSPTVTYTYTSGNTGVATVSNAGLVTGVAQGTTVITVSAATNTNTLTTSVTVNVSAASVSIASLTTSASGTTVPVNLAGVAGQIEATLNINSGAQQIAKVDVLIDNIVAATQNFGVNGAPNAPVTLSINTAEFDMNYAAKWINGPRTISAKITPANGGSPTASNTIQFTLANADVVYFNPAGLTHTGNSASGVNGTWWKGGFTYSSFPVSYSGQIASVGYTSSACGSAAGTTAASYPATFTCSGVESAQTITNNANDVVVTYNAGYTLTLAPTTFMTAASTGYVPGKPVYAAVSTNEDNVGPGASVVAFANGLTAVGSDNWAGSPTTWSASWSDIGVGMTASSLSSAAQTDVSNDGGTSWGFPNISDPLTLAETLTGSGYIASAAPGTDLLGNVGSRGLSSASYGVDLVVLDVRYSATADIATIYDRTGNVAQAVAPWQTTDLKVFTGAAPLNNLVSASAIDTRSGLDNPNALTQSISFLGNVASPCAALPTAMTTLSVNTATPNYVVSAGQDLFCGFAASGYYSWTATVRDRAQNSKGLPSPNTTITAAVDLAAPNVTGLGFSTGLYTAGQPATFSISANDDLELIDGTVALTYTNALLPFGTLRYPFGSPALSSPAFGVAFDNALTPVINGAALTIGYYIGAIEITDGAGNLQANVVGTFPSPAAANVRDVAGAAAAGISAPMLATQFAPIGTSPFAAQTQLTNWRILSNTGGTMVVQHTGPTSISTPYCDAVAVVEQDGANNQLVVVGVISGAPVLTDNGLNRFWTYTSASAQFAAQYDGVWHAVCLKGGWALASAAF
jgi:uncharacterized protein YjdB